MEAENTACGRLERDISIPEAWHRSASQLPPLDAAYRLSVLPSACKQVHPEQQTVSHQTLISQNPFRTPEVLERTRGTRLKAMQESARGAKLFHIDLKVYIFLSQWLILPILYKCTALGPSLRSAMAASGLWGPSVAAGRWTVDDVQALTLLAVLPIFAALYRRLYCSDPGFLGPDSAAQHLQVDDAFVFACPYCGSKPTNRSKHSKITGQCVHKFDHSCWILSTDIGDRNHGIFWMFLFLQVGLILWSLRLMLLSLFACWGATGSSACLLSGAPDAALVGAGVLTCVATLPFFLYLLSLHSYLLATNQTTYEILKGAKLPYLAPYFQCRNTCSTRYHLPWDIHVLWWDEIRGRGPPKPFSHGVFKNIWAQVYTAWPRQYVIATS